MIQDPSPQNATRDAHSDRPADPPIYAELAATYLPAMTPPVDEQEVTT